jgi:hypothetical protein
LLGDDEIEPQPSPDPGGIEFPIALQADSRSSDITIGEASFLT